MSTKPYPTSPSLHALCIDGRDSDIRALLASLLSSSSTATSEIIPPIIDSIASDEGTTPLMYACRYGRSSTVLLLLEHGADPLKKDINGSNALFYAVQYRRSNTVKSLLEFNFATSATSLLESTTNVGNNIIHEASNAGDATILKILLNHYTTDDKIANVINATNREGHTPLHFACDHDTIDCAKLLISQGATVRVLDNDGVSPFHLSCIHRRFEIALLFVSVGGGVDPRRTLSSPSCNPSSSSISSFSIADHFDKKQVQRLVEEFDKCDTK